MESASVVIDICAKAPSGTALARVDDVVVFAELLPLLEVVLLRLMALGRATSAFDEGV